MTTPTNDEARGLAARWGLHLSLTPEDALSIGRAALLRRNGIDCLTVCDLHPRARLVALQARGLMTSTMCQPCDGDGWSTGEDEVEGWELTQLGTPMADADRERLFVWVRERMARVNTAVIGESNLRAVWLMAVANDLGLSLVDGEALCESSGWPS
jgi:hypothetical protein